MSAPITDPPVETPPVGDETPKDDTGKTFDADYVKKLRDEAAKYRTEAKANADAASKLKAIEDRDLSELEKARRDAQEAVQAADKATREALRFRVAASNGISDEDADIFLTGADEDSIKRQAERLVAIRTAAAAPGIPRPDPSQGATPPALNGDPLLRDLKSKLGIT